MNVKTNINATEMPEEFLDEFVCDCMSMSIMLDHNPDKVFDWFRKSVGIVPGKRWIMTPSQVLYINRQATEIIRILRHPERKVVFDVDGVMRDIVKYFGTSDDDWGNTVNGNSIYDMIIADFSCLKKMPDTQFTPVIREFSQEPFIYSTQIEPEAQKYTTEWLKERFHNPQITYVGEDSYRKKDAMLGAYDRIFDDHPKFPETSKLIIVGHGYNKDKPGFRVNTPAEMEGILDVLQAWSPE